MREGEHLGFCEGVSGRLCDGVSGRGAVTLRLWLPILIMIFVRFTPAYQVVAWLAWVPNLLVAYWIIRKARLAIN